MNFIKKLFVFSSIGVLTLLMIGCGQKNIEGSLTDIMAKVYQDMDEEKFPMMLTNTEVTSKNVEYYLGSKDIEFKEALASESSVGSIAYSVVLVRAKEGADVEKVKKQIKESVNPRKWICVGVEEENVIVESKGDLIILIMSNELGSEIQKGFENLK